MAARTGFSKEEQNLILLSRESRHGITLTGLLCNIDFLIHSLFIFGTIIYTFVFNIPGVSCFLSNRICQDPLEKYFGMQCQSGGTNDKPTIIEFAKNSDTLRLIKNMWFNDSKGNCRKSNSIKQSIQDTKSYYYGSDNERPHSKMYMYCYGTNSLNVVKILHAITMLMYCFA